MTKLNNNCFTIQKSIWIFHLYSQQLKNVESFVMTVFFLCFHGFQCWCIIFSTLLIISYPLTILVTSCALQRTRLLWMFFQPPVQRHRIFELFVVNPASPNIYPLRFNRRKPVLVIWMSANVVYSEWKKSKENGMLFEDYQKMRRK